jgi:hypothetical protein
MRISRYVDLCSRGSGSISPNGWVGSVLVADLCVWILQRGMLAQLATRLRQRQAGGAVQGDEDGGGGAIVVDDNCAVSHHSFRRQISNCILMILQIM